MSAPLSLIINSPYTAPSQHWEFVAEGLPLKLAEGRHPAGYMIADPTAKPHQHKGVFFDLPRVNQIRQRVDAWREAGYPGITGITKALLEHWKDFEQREFPFFFCQIEAIETLIWLIETPSMEKVGIDIPGDGGEFRRLCSKLATGTGKTVVMAMLIAWQVINRATYPRDPRFSKDVFVVAPNLTVRERLSVLIPSRQNNYYEEFSIVPLSLQEKLWQANILIRNWHALNWETEEKIRNKKGVDKRGAKSDEAYVRDVLGEMADARNFIVINDEAHHAWRVPAESKMAGVKKEEIEEATKWVGGLDRLHKKRGILYCFDFSATPFAPSGKKTAEEALFGWIVSDFGLNDAIESGLVKTPRVVVRDDGKMDIKTFNSRFDHIYSHPDVKDDLNRRAKSDERLPDLVINAYALLGLDWEETTRVWQKTDVPPVMITVANRTETAARIKYAFDNKDIPIDSLCEREGILHIDSNVLKRVESRETDIQSVEMINPENSTERKTTKKEDEALLREKVNTVGQAGKPGAKIQNVISVGMLSEGWDARTVTQIMGLRAFTSQLLCEQVVGRGLRRASYEINAETKLFDAEYVNVFGVPFSFLPHEESSDTQQKPPSPKITIQPVKEKQEFTFSWPNVIRINRTYKPTLSLAWKKIKPLKLDMSEIVEMVELAPTVNGKPDFSKIKDIDIEKLFEKSRKQTRIFKAAQAVYKEMETEWKEKSHTSVLVAELVRLAEQFMDSDRIQISPALFNQDSKKRQAIIILSMSKVIQHFLQAINYSNTEKLAIVLDPNRPICSTGDMRLWRTGKPCMYTKKSHINYCVFDSGWEKQAAVELDRNKAVRAWAKNDHLGFNIFYMHKGAVKKYLPDWLIQLKSGDFLVLETKGKETEKDEDKYDYMKEWIDAVNEDGRFGRWMFEVSRSPSDVKDLLAKASAVAAQD